MKNFQQTPRERRKVFADHRRQFGQYKKAEPRRTFAEGWSGKRRISLEPISRLCRTNGFDVYYDLPFSRDWLLKWTPIH